MSTCNFSYSTLSRHYTIGMNDTDGDSYEWELNNVIDELCTIKAFRDQAKEEWLPGSSDKRILGYFWVTLYDPDYKQWTDEKIYITIESGYYQGAMIDMSLSAIEGYTINKTTQNKIDAIARKVEKVLSKCTLNLRWVAVFSNGEGIYEKINNSFK